MTVLLESPTMPDRGQPDGPLPKDRAKLDAALRKAIKVARKRMTWDEILRVVAECSAEDPEPVSTLVSKKPSRR